jgi:PAS domain S-box-containing protein
MCLQGSLLLKDLRMGEKPTYEELVQRVKDLEEKVEKQKNTDAALETLLKGTVRNGGEEFVENLARDLCAALNVKYAMICLLTGEKRDRVKTFSMWSPDGYMEMFEYALEGTSCEKVLIQEDCLYFDEVQEQFVEDETLVKMGIQSYFGSPLRDANGNVIGILSLMHDEKMEDQAFKRKMLDLFSNKVEMEFERRITEKALRESEERYRSFVDNAPMAMYTINTKGEFTYGNKKLLEMTGYKEEDWLLKPYHPIVYPDDLNIVMEKVQNRLSGKGTQEPYEMRIYHASGNIMWVKITSESICETDENGNKRLVGMQTFVDDITEKKVAEQVLKKREETLSSIFRAAPTSIGLVSNRVIQQANDRLCEMVGYSKDELIGQSARMLYPSDEDYGFVGSEKYDQIQKFGTGTVETRWRCKDGEVMDVLLSSTPIQPDDLSAGVTFTALDITEQKKMIEQLKEDRDREQMFLDIAEVMFLALDSDGKVTLINKKGCEVLGYTEAEILGRSWFDYFLPEEQREGARSVFQQLMVGKVKPAEYVENPILTKDGEKRYIDWHNISLKNRTGAIMGTFSSGEDITERKEAQEERMELQIQLQQAQKMEAIGTLAGGIAHDFNNILMPLLIHTEMTLEALPEDSPWIFNLEEVLKAGNRAKDLVKQILTFSRQSEEQKTHLKLRFVIEDCMKLLRSSLPSTIEIQLNIETQPGLDTVYADFTQLHQILMNICTNAYHAMREKGGILEIRLENINIDSNSKDFSPDLIPGTYHQLSIRDTGRGMEKETMDRIFDPYFTTKEKGEGTGLGLSVVHGIVKNHEGVITVESEPGDGTTFHVFLPVAEQEEKIEIKKAVGMPKGDERVLFVDDEQSMTRVIRVMLERLGYTVKVRTNSLEALEAFRANPDEFDLLITDQTMPHMTGSELARKIMHIRQDIPIILCSGFSQKMNKAKAQKMGIRAFVMKPLIMSELAQIIRTVLDQKN